MDCDLILISEDICFKKMFDIDKVIRSTNRLSIDFKNEERNL